MGSPKAPKPTPAEQAFERQQQKALSDEIKAENRRRKASIQANLGVSTLLSGLPAQTVNAGQPAAITSPSVANVTTGTLNGGRPTAGRTTTTPRASGGRRSRSPSTARSLL